MFVFTPYCVNSTSAASGVALIGKRGQNCEVIFVKMCVWYVTPTIQYILVNQCKYFWHPPECRLAPLPYLPVPTLPNRPHLPEVPTKALNKTNKERAKLPLETTSCMLILILSLFMPSHQYLMGSGVVLPFPFSKLILHMKENGGLPSVLNKALNSKH